MRERRPHLFSDTIRSSEPQIAREVLDYHLETLTKRKQEYQFEHFARALAEKELCPNLRTQTGPTGGGDAKVVAVGCLAERYGEQEPARVADELAAEAVEMTAYEDFVTEEVRKGRSILGLYPPTDEQSRADFAAWRAANQR